MTILTDSAGIKITDIVIISKQANHNPLFGTHRFSKHPRLAYDQ